MPGDIGLQVHRDNILDGLTEAPATQYPVVRAVVGDAFFGPMAREFLRVSSPNGPVMIGYGATFAALLFIMSRGPGVLSLDHLIRRRLIG